MVKHGTKKLNSEQIRSSIKKLTAAKTLWVAYSGGLDSHVLLDLVVNAFDIHEYKIGVIHVHHGLSPYADTWVKHCERICSDYKVPLRVLYVDAKVKEGESPEEMARIARFNAWKDFLQRDEAILLAHHEADQAETLLLRLFRGAGPLGLAGMSAKTTLGNSELLRPLLACSKEDIIHYAKEHNLHWIEDESNQNPRFDRNYLRLEILPLLINRWPRVVKSMGRAAGLCGDAANAIQILAAEDLNNIKEGTSLSLSVKRLLSLESSRRRSVIRLWLQDQGFLLPSKDHMDRIDREVLMAQSGAKPSLKISDYLIKRIKGELTVIRIHECSGAI